MNATSEFNSFLDLEIQVEIVSRPFERNGQCTHGFGGHQTGSQKTCI